MNSLKPMRFFSAIPFTVILGLVFATGFAVPAMAQQDVPDIGPLLPVVVKPMESHIGNITGHSANAKSDYRLYCTGCHGD